MYIRSKLQQNALDCLTDYTESHFSGMRVTRGYVVSRILSQWEHFLSEEAMVERALQISDEKKGHGIPVNLNVTSQAFEQLNCAKLKLDQYTGRSLFPAQVIEILLICATSQGQDSEGEPKADAADMDFKEELLRFQKLDDAQQRLEIYKLLLKLAER